jgi:hypothetical protein
MDLDMQDLCVIFGKKGARQIRTSGEYHKRYEQRSEAIAEANRLGVTYRVTQLSVEIGQTRPRKKTQGVMANGLPIPDVVAPKAPRAVPKLGGRHKTLWTRPQGLQRVRRTSRADIE